jgi:hypothetical protein
MNNFDFTNNIKLVSLGNWCNSRANINYFYNPNNNCMKTENNDSGLFDWVFVINYDNICELFDNKMEHLFKRENLLILESQKYKNWIYDRKYKIIFNHLYNNKDEPLTEIKLDEIYEDLYSKINYLKIKSLNLKEYRTIYIITLSNHNWMDENIRPIIPELKTVLKLRDSIKSFRGNKNFIILALYSKKEKFSFENCENIYFHSVNEIGFFMRKNISNEFNLIISEYISDYSNKLL